MKKQEWLPVKKAAEVLRIPKHSLYGWVYTGKVEAEKVGGCWRVNPDSLGKKEMQHQGRVVVNLLSLQEELKEALKTISGLINFEKRKKRANLRTKKGVDQI